MIYIRRVLEASAVLKDFAGYAAANRIRLTPHALSRADERGATYRDVRHALMTATACTLQPNGRWLVASADLSGDALTLVCVPENGVLVVTLF